ncbi:hypothetical protein HDU87_004999 [Geranomyces variabilis]|uniref:37S ribosomal protein mrp10, mitochondrial n=1 Tax=Geranomyces variabilis TaxID=109894 RepID=A0AAD5TTA0_9FUNG|nr:hypothetical protein HDU87_004999 [Geranomyces variabilis]
MRAIDRIRKPLALRPPKVQSATACAVELATLFNCWRAMSVDAVQCAESGKALMTCMAAQGAKTGSSQSVDEINHWIGRAARKKQL